MSVLIVVKLSEFLQTSSRTYFRKFSVETFLEHSKNLFRKFHENQNCAGLK